MGMAIAHHGPVICCFLLAFLAAATALLPNRTRDKWLIIGLVLTGAVIESLRLLSLPPAALPNSDEITATGIVLQPVRHSGKFWSADLEMTSEDNVRTGLRLRVLIPDSLGSLSEGRQISLRGRLRGLRSPRNPGQKDWDAALRRRGGTATLWATGISEASTSMDRKPSLRVRVGTAVETTLSTLVGGKEGRLALAVLLGARESMERETIDDFREAGIVHVLAISGLHVLVVVGMLFQLGKLLLPGHRLPAFFTLIGLGLYVYIVGPQASVVRAGIMGAAILIGLILNRRSDPANSVGLAGLLLLLTEPRWLWEPGFQLSFGATLGILLFTPRILSGIGSLPRLLKWTVGMVAASLGAQLGILPIALYHFRQWPTYGLAANIPAILCLTVLLWASVATVLAAPIMMPLALIAAHAVRLTALTLFLLAGYISSLPESLNLWGESKTWLLVMLWAGGMGVLLGKQRKHSFLLGLGGTLVALNVWMAWGAFDSWEGNGTRIVFLHIDRGNTVALEQSGDEPVLIDPGSPGLSSSASRAASDYLYFRRREKFSYCCATGVSKERLGALKTLFHSGLIGKLLAPEYATFEADSIGIEPLPWPKCPSDTTIGGFRLTPLGISSDALDGLLVSSPSGLEVLISGEDGWKADARLASMEEVEDVDVLYIGPTRGVGPSHLLLRRSRPKLIVFGGGTEMEAGLTERLISTGYPFVHTRYGAVIVEQEGNAITWRQWKRS